MLVGERLDMTQPWALTAQRAKRVLGCIQSSVGSRGGRGFCSGETLPGTLHPALGAQHRKDRDLLEWVQRRDTNLFRGMEHFSYEERLREW